MSSEFEQEKENHKEERYTDEVTNPRFIQPIQEVFHCGDILTEERLVVKPLLHLFYIQ